MTVNLNPVRTMERATTLSMTTDVTVWQDSMILIVKIVCIFSWGLFYHGQTPHTLSNNCTDSTNYYVTMFLLVLKLYLVYVS